MLPHHMSMPAAGPAFYARVYHPAFNLDLEDAEDTLQCFQTHTKAVGKGIQGLRAVFGKVRESRLGNFLSHLHT
jgi:sorting nexin-9/18/33